MIPGKHRFVLFQITITLNHFNVEVQSTTLLFIITKSSDMKHTILLLLTIAVLNTFSQSLNKRIVHNDPAKYRQLNAVHAGAGQMKFTGLFGSQTLATNLLYLHVGEIPDKAGIGEHFHHTIEEMYVILDGEAEFTVNGRTSKIKG